MSKELQFDTAQQIETYLKELMDPKPKLKPLVVAIRSILNIK